MSDARHVTYQFVVAAICGTICICFCINRMAGCNEKVGADVAEPVSRAATTRAVTK